MQGNVNTNNHASILNVAKEVLGARSRESIVEISDDNIVIVKTTEDRLILGIVPIKAEYSVQIDTDTNEVLDYKKPWYDGISTST